MNFLRDYQIYSSGDEAPSEYHAWAAFMVLASCCGPNVWMTMGKFNIQPNLFMMFVGPPGIRKSTAKDVAKELMIKIGDIPLVASSTTKEALVDDLSGGKKDDEEPSRHIMTYEWNGKHRRYSKATILSDEFVNLVSHGGDPLAYIQFLTEVYNPQVEYANKTVGRGTKKVPYPYINLLGCITPELTASLINQNALSGGFSRRTLYIYANKNGKPVPIPRLTAEQLEAKERLILRGKQIQKLAGEFHLDAGGLAVYESWYGENFAQLSSTPTQALAYFLQSKPNIVLKMAMLFHLAQNDTLILTAEDLSFAIEMVTSAQQHIETVFSSVGRNPLVATLSGIELLVKQVCARSPHYITRKKIHGAFIKDAKISDIDVLLNDMSRADPPKLHFVKVKFGNGDTVEVITAPEHHDKFVSRVTGSEAGLRLPNGPIQLP